VGIAASFDSSGGRVKVLLVCSDAALGAKISASITRAGADVHYVTSGERAMDRFIQEAVDVVVIDHHLEGRDAVATIGAIRWMPGGRRARVVLFASEEPIDRPLAEHGQSIDAVSTLVAPGVDAIAQAALQAADARPHEAETRVVSVDDLERSQAWEDVTSQGEPARSSPPEPEREDEWRDTDGRAEGREVRALAEAADQTFTDLAGTFDRMPFARVLHRLSVKRATGALVCVHPPDDRQTTEGAEPTKVVYFRAGVPVHVRSNLVGECLGEVLVKKQKIGPATLRESLAAVERGEGLHGQILIHMGALSALDLSEALAEQLRAKLSELFGWTRGTFRFGDHAPPRALIEIGLGLADIVTAGVRDGMTPSQVLDRLAPHAEHYAVIEPRELVRFVRDGAVPRSIRNVDGTRRVRELLEQSDDALATARLLHAMECLEAVRFTTEKTEAPFAHAPEEVTPLRPVPEVSAVRAAAWPEIPPIETLPGVSRAKPIKKDPDSGSGLREKKPARDEDSQPVLDERVERLLSAERHFRRGQAALDRGKPEQAVSALERAADLCPDQGQFLAYLGWAKHAAAPDDAFVLSEAVDLAERGCTRAPDLAIGHLLRARLLVAIGRAADARAAFRRSLELDPTLEEARAAIE
jgi:CheY-like chemotaxis protein